ncbi:MAG: hypothetical protein HOV87_07780 [Catenulispora sp.]|nr:hypothetical protein [Catenulispora sp.]
MTEDLTTRLHDLADSAPPRVMDVEGVLQQGRRSLRRQQAAALGGGTAVLAATGLALSVLAHTGSAASGTPVAGGTPATSAAATKPSAPAPALDPHDPIVTHWQFGYLPEGMTVDGDAGSLNATASMVWAYADSGFGLRLQTLDREPPGQPDGKGSLHKISTQVQGAAVAYWYGDDGRGGLVQDVNDSLPILNMARLVWQLPSGQWFMITAVNVDTRTDWKEQTLKAAAQVIRQDRSAPAPIRLTRVPEGFSLLGGVVTRDILSTFIAFGGITTREIGGSYGELDLTMTPSDPAAARTKIVAFPLGKKTDDLPPMQKDDTDTCADANGLTVCVIVPRDHQAALKAIGGAEGLLQRVTALGDDPAKWTTDVVD